MRCGADVVRRERAAAVDWRCPGSDISRPAIGGRWEGRWHMRIPAPRFRSALVVSGGCVVLQSHAAPSGACGAGEFFLGALTTARAPDEMIVALEWRRAAADAGHAFEEIAQRHGDFAIAAAACQLRIDRSERLAALSLGLGGVESRPIAVDVESFIGRPLRGVAPSPRRSRGCHASIPWRIIPPARNSGSR